MWPPEVPGDGRSTAAGVLPSLSRFCYLEDYWPRISERRASGSR